MDWSRRSGFNLRVLPLSLYVSPAHSPSYVIESPSTRYEVTFEPNMYPSIMPESVSAL